jgi:hypothetical protein
VGLIGGLIKASLAKRLYTEARKPHNQQRAKDLYRSVTGKGGGSRPPRR